jgi:2-phospho-L-lactate guanylyltransferase
MPMLGGGMRAGWTIAVAIKPLTAAKSRLRGSLSPEQRATLANAMAADVLAAVGDATTVVRRLVVTADRGAARAARDLGAGVILEPEATGLNAAFARAIAHVGDAPLGLLVGDLPGITAAAIDRALAAVPATRPAVIGDADGKGSVLLAARSARLLQPRFGPDSRARHIAVGASDGTDWWADDLRRDVDDLAALKHIAAGGAAGPSTTDWLMRSVLPALAGDLQEAGR